MNSLNKTTQKTSFPILLLLHFLLFLLISITFCPLSAHACHEEERRARLNFKSSLDDPSGRLSTWQEGVQHRNCCDWSGIGCSYESFRVFAINLGNTKLEEYVNEISYGDDFNPPSTSLRGKLSPSLFDITHLEYLDLSFNDFQQSDVPIQFSYLTKLNHLDLSFTNFSASISTHFNNLTFLRYLDLSCYFPNAEDNYGPSCLESPSTKWMRGLVNLQVLRLSGIDLFKATSSSKDNFSQHISYLSNLRDIDVSGCNISGPVFPIHHFHNLSHLSSLRMNHNNYLNSSIPLQVANLTSLSILDLSDCQLQGSIPYLSQLKALDVSYNHNLDPNLNAMFQHRWPKLQLLDISGTKNASGSIPSSISNAPQLVSLSASECSIQGSLPSSICKIFPLQYLNLRHNNITQTIPACKFTYLKVMDLSRNNFTGAIPSSIYKLNYLDLSNNELSGLIPYSICLQKPGMPYNTTDYINLSNNKLSGIIPSSIGSCSPLTYLNLANNNLTGVVPNELQHTNLEYLELNDNNLNGMFPMFIRKLLSLRVLNLGNNKFEGIIPTGLGSLNNLAILLLRSNRFNGSIPEEITHLQQLQILDFSFNNFSGPIPTKLGDLTKLTSRLSKTLNIRYGVQYQLAMKNTTAQFEQFYIRNSGIDLSCNFMDGNIPEDIGLLQGLVMLNLSHNQFSSNIPDSIGNMSNLESLDLSSNRLSGHIPQSLTSIDTLGYLSLSHNNLSGKIPRGNHFDTLSLDGSAFAGNDSFCGLPSEEKCPGDHSTSSSDASPSSKVDEDDQEDAKEKFLLYAIAAMGFAVGFWSLFFVLLLKKHKWWFPYWRTIDSVAVRIVEGCIL